MRLIDADAEIEKIKEDIDRKEQQLGRLLELEKQEPYNGYVNISEKIADKIKYINDCKDEIRILESCNTAYELDSVVERLEKCSRTHERIMCGCADVNERHLHVVVSDTYKTARKIVEEGVIHE